MGKGQQLYNKAKQLIPGGTQLLSKRPEMFLPDEWPAYYSKAKGCDVWDLDGNKYTDMSLMGVGSNILGYCNDYVDAAVVRAVQCGNMNTLNCPEEVELAEKICSIHPWADMVRYSKSGGESMSIAVRIARAATNRDVVLVSGYHGWHDWYLAANIESPDQLADVHLAGLEPLGVPKSLSGSNYPFHYNNYDEFERLLVRFGNQIAAVVVEPIRSDYPEDEFLAKVMEKTRKNGSVLIFDEISCGMRLCVGGAHRVLGVNPDMAVFAKAVSNGYPQGIILGIKSVMEAAQGSFISSTFWTERIGLSASLATLEFYEKHQVEKHLEKIGAMVQDGWLKVAKDKNINIHVDGIKPMSHIGFAYENPLAWKTYFTQEMLALGFLASNVFYASYGHSEMDVERYLDACGQVFEKMADAIRRRINIEILLSGPVCHGGFERLTK